MADEQGKATTNEQQPDGASQSEPQRGGAEDKQEQSTQAPQQPAGQAGTEEGEGLTDRHGQPAIAKGKYERDLAAKDGEIAELKAKLDELSRTEEGRKEQQERIAKLEAELAEAKVDHSLELAGCVNVKAARAILPDYDSDVAKLKEACPYLFGQEQKPQAGSTGLPASGAPDSGLDEKLDRAFGLKKK